MAIIESDELTITISKLYPNKSVDLERTPFIDDDQIETIKEAIEQVINDDSMIVSIEKTS